MPTTQETTTIIKQTPKAPSSDSTLIIVLACVFGALAFIIVLLVIVSKMRKRKNREREGERERINISGMSKYRSRGSSLELGEIIDDDEIEDD